MIGLYRATCRVQIVGNLDAVMKEPGPVLLASWHQDLLFTFAYLTRYARQRRIAVLVSQSKDGGIAAGVLAWFGFITVRGSSSRGGKAALEELCERVLEDQVSAAIVCDGPRPPARVAKPGLIKLSRVTGRPIFMLRSWGARQYIFKKSWPRLALVLPFSRVVIMVDGPLFVPPQPTEEEKEKFRFELETRLNRLASASEEFFMRPAK